MDSFKKLSFSECLEYIDRQKFHWMMKRLSGNDTGLTKSHQVGVYCSANFIKEAIPTIYTTDSLNPDAIIHCYFPQFDSEKQLRAIYYNNKHFPDGEKKKTRNEFRVTKWGGKDSPIQNPDNTGCPFLIAIKKQKENYVGIVLIAESKEEESLIEEWYGADIEPSITYDSSTQLNFSQINSNYPVEWNSIFPTGKELYKFIQLKLPRSKWSKSIDNLLLARRNLEFDLFSQIESAHILPLIHKGFSSIDSFISAANSVTNRRKSRSGKSLELNLEAIFNDEQLEFDTQAFTEERKKPDFLFPSASKYHSDSFPKNKLRMLAAKTCCKDRWRQVINEADKISPKHLFTLQEGVSPNQLKEMKASSIKLVIPEPHLKSFPENWRNSITTLEQFISNIRDLQSP